VRYTRPSEAAAASSDRDECFGLRIPNGPEATKSLGVSTLSSPPPGIERRLCTRCGVCGGSTPSTTRRFTLGRPGTATRASQAARGGCACATGPGAVRLRSFVPIVSVIVAELGHRLRPAAHRCALGTTPQTATPAHELASRRMGAHRAAKLACRAPGEQPTAASRLPIDRQPRSDLWSDLWDLCDAATGLIEEGTTDLKRMRDQQPWPTGEFAEALRP
jgi:hypothetical protein